MELASRLGQSTLALSLKSSYWRRETELTSLATLLGDFPMLIEPASPLFCCQGEFTCLQLP